MTPFLYSIWPQRIGIFQLLANTSGVNLTAQNNYMRNIYHLAAAGNRPDIIEALAEMDIGVNVNDQNSDGYTALFIACEHKRCRVISALFKCKGLDVNAKCQKGRTALHIAAKQDDTGPLKLLLAREDINVNVQDQELRTPLHFATCCDRIEAVSLLLNHPGINPNLVDSQGKSPLAFALFLLSLPMLTMFMSSSEVMLDLTVLAKTDILHGFASSGDVDAVHGLLQRGLPADKTDENGVCFSFIGLFWELLLLMETEKW